MAVQDWHWGAEEDDHPADEGEPMLSSPAFQITLVGPLCQQHVTDPQALFPFTQLGG